MLTMLRPSWPWRGTAQEAIEPAQGADQAGAVAGFFDGFSPAVAGLVGVSIVLVLMGFVTWSILTSRRMHGSSVFNRLFVVVATTSAFFSAVSSAIGFSLITSQETSDFFRNAILPPAFGVFVFFLGVAIWVGGAELVRSRDWFRGVADGFVGDILFFLERCLKLFVVIPILAVILFFVSTWTTVVGIGGVDAVRHTYGFEVARLQAECAAISAYRQKDMLFQEELRLAVADVRRVADNERTRGTQTGSVGAGPASDYFEGVATWLEQLEESVGAIVAENGAATPSPYESSVCDAKADRLKTLLGANAYDNVDLWSRSFETEFNDFVVVLNRWRQDRRIERLLEAQLGNFERANPRPTASASPLTRAQVDAMKAYADQVESALKSFIRKQKLSKPSPPLASAAEISPERGLDIVFSYFRPRAEPVEQARVPRTQAQVEREVVPGLSTITPRDAVLKNASVFSDVWALGIAWDYASYILMLAYLFFPSAERAAGFKDRRKDDQLSAASSRGQQAP